MKKFVVKMEGGFLVGIPYTDTLFIRTSWSVYDAYPFSRLSIAKRVARRVGGSVVEFDPINGVVS